MGHLRGPDPAGRGRRDHRHHAERQHRRVLRADRGRGPAGHRGGGQGGSRGGRAGRPGPRPGGRRARHGQRGRGRPARAGSRRRDDHDPPAGAPLPGRRGLGGLPPGHRRCGPGPGRGALRPERARHRGPDRRPRRALPERDRHQVRGQGRHPVRGGGAGRRAGPLHLAGRASRALRPRVLGLRRARVHLGPGQRQPGAVAVPAGGAARRRPHRGDGCVGGHPAVRGPARGGRGRGQRERREGSAGAAGPVRPGCAAAEPGPARYRTGGGGSHPAVLGPVRGQ